MLKVALNCVNHFLAIPFSFRKVYVIRQVILQVIHKYNSNGCIVVNFREIIDLQEKLDKYVSMTVSAEEKSDYW